ncbi:MAG: tetratricopeptide repeat protein [Planctomycetes bacterium]|nr:tetratricopeptide repeat protein [Planctomycetota bacterium]
MIPDSAVAGDGPSDLAGRLADDMAARWRLGESPVAEVYFDHHPELWRRPDAALELIAEELALRHEHGRPTSFSELARRFPQWRAQVETLWRCQHEFGPGPAARSALFPGDQIGEFRLLSELGRGANGTVFLATQPALGGRTVVLKLTPAAGDEHISLARLQHSHIVPLYSAHEFPERGLRGLCLPYFGRTTFAALLSALSDVPVGERSGASVLTALRGAENESLAPLPVSGPACDALRNASYVETVCRIGACLAEALAYAHSRGLVHLDVKPSNVLIAADGEPMLLDFHLARAPLAAGAEPPVWLGGTPGYMAPELAAAVEAVRRARLIPGGVDARADVYSLGLLLREALGLSAAEVRTSVPTGLRDVLARCTAADPNERYPSAAHLAADLRRHLADLPLRGVPNRSVAERWRKWRRRRPFALPAALVGAAVIAFGVGTGLHFARQVERAETVLRDGESHLQHCRYAEGAEVLRGGEVVLRGVPFSGSLGRRLHDARQRAERARAAADLHHFCERVRPLYAAELVAPADARETLTRCRELWAERQQIAARLEGQPTAELEKRWRADLLDIGVLVAHLGARLAPPADNEPAHRQALTVLDEAESLLGPRGVLHLERAAHARAVGQIARAEEAERRAVALPPRTAWEHLLAGRAHLAAGDLARAAVEFDRCLELDPTSLWGHEYRGLCLLRAHDAAAAASAFSACVALAPQTAWCYADRGVAYAEAGRLEWARADLDRALALDPNCVAARIGRATVHSRSGRFAEALADLQGARAAGAAPATVHYRTAVIHLAAGDRRSAAAALRDCLACDPAHPEAKSALARLEPDR